MIFQLKKIKKKFFNSFLCATHTYASSPLGSRCALPNASETTLSVAGGGWSLFQKSVFSWAAF